MVSYKCDRCCKLFKQKIDYTRHINRKIPCKSGEEGNNNIAKNPVEPAKHPAESAKNLIPATLLDANTSTVSKKNVCNYCNRMFTRSDSLNKHLAGRCKVKKQQDSQKEDLLQKLVKEMSEMKEIIKQNNEKINKLETENSKYAQKISGQQNNIINTQNNIDKQQNNIQINNSIKLLAFGKEDMSHLADEVYKKILNKGFKSVPTFVHYLHFNKDKPQNHNVYISNMQTNYALVYDGEDWKLKERDEILQQLIDEKTEILSLKFDEILNKLDEPTIRKFRRFLEQSDENEVICTIKNDLKLLLYNNKKIPEKTRELLRTQDETKMIKGN
jgi:hypothetical protein